MADKIDYEQLTKWIVLGFATIGGILILRATDIIDIAIGFNI